jgi:hypothetical protein
MESGIALVAVIAAVVAAEPVEVLALQVGFEHRARPHAQAAANLDLS